MKRRTVLTSISSIALGSALAGCSSGGSTGTLATSVSDQPADIEDFDTLLIRIDGIRVKPENEELRRLEADAEVDLTELVGEASELVDETDLEAGSYEFLQLDATATEATLSAGGSATVELPGEAPLKFEHAFDVQSDQTTSFLADFTPVKQGQTGRYVLQPVADEVEVTYQTDTEG